MQPRKTLVIGGAGYIGSRLVPELLESGRTVDVVDLEWFGNALPKGVSVMNRDALSLEADDLAGYDEVIFLAGLSNDPMAEFSPRMNYLSNASTPAHVAHMAKKAGVNRLVYAGSCSVYGFHPTKDASESDQPQTQFPYGVSKLQGEVGCLQLAGDGFSVIALRQGTVSGYSPRMRFDLMINTMYKSAAEGVITVRNPSIVRPLLVIDDAVRAYLAALAAPPGLNGVFNVATANFSVGEAAAAVADHFKKAHDRSVSIDVQNTHDLRNYRVSIEKATRDLKYEPRASLESLLSDLDAHFGPDFDFSPDRYYNIKVFSKLP